MPTAFELELDDTSPVVNYFPFAETLGAPDFLAGWNSFFSDSGFLTELGQIGQGTSLHVTSLDGAALTIEWVGTGISLFGSAFKAAYTLSLDGGEPSLGLPTGELLGAYQGLEQKQHTIALIAHPNASLINPDSYVAFDRALLNATVDHTAATVSSQYISIADSDWFLIGDWTSLSAPVIDLAPFQTYQRSSTQGNIAEISFEGSAVAVIGVRNVTSGHYNVTLDGTTTTFDGHSDWFESSTLFLQADLDETTKHSLAITNAGNATLAIVGLNITHAIGGTPDADNASTSSGFSAGTVIALVLAVLLAVVAIISLIFYACKRRRRVQVQRTNIAPRSSLDPYLHAFTGIRPDPSLQRYLNHQSAPRWSGFVERQVPAGTSEQPQLLPTERLVSDANDEEPLVLTAPSRRDSIDPASPTPYLRLPMSVRMSVASPPMQREPLEKLREELDEERKGVPETEGPSREQEQGKEGHENPNFEEDASERPLRGLMKNDKRDTSESALQSLIVTDAHSSSEGNQETVRPIVHRRRSRFSRQKSTAESGSSKGLQLRISDSNPDVPNTSKKTLLLVSPLRTPRRSSAGSVLTFSEIPNTPRSSILTTPFAQDRRESGRILWSLRSERGTSERSPEDIPSPGIFQRLRGRREPPQSSPWRPPSVWGPPPAEDLPY